MNDPTWTILIATLSRRRPKLMELLSLLLPQCEATTGVDVLACSNNAERPLGEIRQSLLLAATGDYVSFVDDDDAVTGDFVAKMTSALASRPDCVGFQVAYTEDGVPGWPTYLSINLKIGDRPDPAWYRHITHVQPVRREIARLGDFRDAWPEDNAWAVKVGALLASEVYIDEVMYHYRFCREDSVQYPQMQNVPGSEEGVHYAIAVEPRLPRPEISSPVFSWLELS